MRRRASYKDIMMHHLAAYTESFTGTTEDDTTAAADSQLTIQNNHVLPQRPVDLVFWGGASATASRQRLNTPTIGNVTSPFLRDLSVAANFGIPQRLASYVDNPMRLEPLEEIQIFHTHTAAVAEQNYAFLGLMLERIPSPAGRVYTIRGTATGTLTANAWTNVGTITWQNNLPTGRYACIGGTFFSATALAGRFAFENQVWRPGGLGIVGLGNPTDRIFRNGVLGVWGYFFNYAMPQVEMFASAADVSEEVTMDIVRLS